MSYNQDQDNFYEDYYREAQETVPRGLNDIPVQSSFTTSDFLKLGATLVAYPLLVGILERSGRRVGTALNRSLGSKLGALSQRVVPNTAYARTFTEAIRTGSTPTLSQTISSAYPENRLSMMKNVYQKKVTHLSRDYMEWKGQMDSIRSRMTDISPIRARAMRAESFFSNMKRGAFLRSGAVHHAQGYLGRSIAFYAADRIIGGLTGRKDGPSPFNVPGTLLDYAKFTAGFYPIDALLMGGGKIAMAGANVGTGALQGVIDRNRSQVTEMLARTSKNAEQWRQIMLAGASGISGAWKEVGEKTEWSNVFNAKFLANQMTPTRAVRTSKYIGMGWRKGLARRRAIERNARTRAPFSGALEQIYEAYELTAKNIARGGTLAGMPKKDRDLMLRSALDFSDQLQAGVTQLKGVGGLWRDLMGFKKATLTQEQATALAGRVQDLGLARATAASRKRIEAFAKNMYQDSPIYDLGGGRTLDLSPLDPRAGLRKIFKNVSSHGLMGVPMSLGTNIAGMLGFYKGKTAHAYTSHEAFHVGKIESETLLKSIDSVQRELANKGVFRPIRPETAGAERQGGLFLLGKHYLVTPEGLEQVSQAGRRFRMISSAHSSYFPRIIGLHQGYPVATPEPVDEVSRINNWRGSGRGFDAIKGKTREFLHRWIFRPAEMFSGLGESESIMAHLRGMVTGKYMDAKSPLNLFSEESAIFHDRFIGPARRAAQDPNIRGRNAVFLKEQREAAKIAIRTTLNIINLARVNASNVVLRKSEFLRDLLRDTNIEDLNFINVGKALEEDEYLWKALQDVNPNEKILKKNQKVASYISQIKGRGFDFFLDLMEQPSARGLGTLKIDKMAETRQFLLEEALETALGQMGRASGDGLRRMAESSGKHFLDSLSNKDMNLLRIFSLRKPIMDTTRNLEHMSDDKLITALETIHAFKGDLYGISKDWFMGFPGIFSSGHIPRIQLRQPSPLTEAMDHSPLVSIPDNFLIPGSMSMKKMFRSFFPKGSDGKTGPEDEMTRAGMIPMWLMDRFSRVGELVGMAPNPESRRSAVSMMATFTKWGAAASAGGFLYHTADAMIDASPMFEGTMFDEGISVAAAEQLVKARLAMGGIQDLTGTTSLYQYMEGLAPGSVTSPGSRFMRAAGPMMLFPAIGFKAGGHKGAAAGALAGLVVGMHGFVTDERDRNRLIEEYSGRKDVGVRKGRFWELGRQPFQGTKIDYYRPNWFHRLKAQYEYTPEGLGSKLESAIFADPPLGFNPIGGLVDPYHYSRTNYLTRPYPETAPIGRDIPFVGPLVAAATSRLPGNELMHLPYTAPRIRMHEKELARSFGMAKETASGPAPGYFTPEFLRGYQEQSYMNSPGSIGGLAPYPRSQTDAAGVLQDMEYKAIIEPLGLVGFSHEAIMGRITGKGNKSGLFEQSALMENASEIGSFRKRYWDMNLGGLMGLTEFWRRFIPRRMYATEYYNEIPNKMPDWLNAGDRGIDFTVGDGFSKITEGLLRLPGRGYESARNVRKDFPMRASSMGFSTAQMTERLLGMQPPLDDEAFDITTTGTYLHRIIQQQLARDNLLVEAERLVYDPYNNISGHIDAVIRRGGKPEVMEIKSIDGDKLATLAAPKSTAVSQTNFYMRSQGARKGTILYVSREDPRQTKSFTVHYSERRFQEDLARLKEARIIAFKMSQDGYGFPGAGYSNLDKLAILADVAPYSGSFNDTLKIVKTAMRAGTMTPEEIEKLHTITDQRRERARGMDAYPYRFKGRLMEPSDTYPTGLNPNNYIKPAAEYSLPERSLGALWEGFCVPEDEYIETDKGYIMACHVIEGDLVRTHLGEMKPVTKVHRREAFKGEMMFSIRAGHKIYLRVTQDHGVFCERGWVKAKDITRRDTLLRPIPKIDLKVWSPATDLSVVPNSEVVEIDGVEMVRVKWSNRVVQRHLPRSQQFLRVMGYYLARGSIMKNDKGNICGFYLNYDQELVKEDFTYFMMDNYVKVGDKKFGWRKSVKCTSAIFSRYLNQEFGSHVERKIPDWIMNAPLLELRAFLKGFIMNYVPNITRKFGKNLLFQMSTLLVRAGIPHTISRSRGRVRTYKLEVDPQKAAEILGIPFTPKGLENPDMTFTQTHCRMKVTDIDHAQAKGVLMDFTVADSHSYSTSVYVVHNSHLDSPVHTRLLNYRSPTEQYERTRIYGRDSSFWEHPVRDFLDPWVSSARASNNPVQSSIHGAFLGGLFGGPAGALAGIYGGAAYGGAHGAAQAAGMPRWVPERVSDQRDFEAYFDKLRYIKAKRLYDLTAQEEFRQAMGETMTGLDVAGMGKDDFTSMFRASPHAEKALLGSFLNITDQKEQEKILEAVPEVVGDLLRIKWAIKSGQTDMNALGRFREKQDVEQFLQENSIPGSDWVGWTPAAHMDDIKLLSAQRQGWSSHDFGLGWRDQMRRIQNSPLAEQPIQMTKLVNYAEQGGEAEQAINRSELIGAINGILRSNGVQGRVMVDSIPGSFGGSTPTGAPPDQVTIKVQRNQTSPKNRLNSPSPLQGALINA